MEAAQHLQERTYPATFAKFAGLALGVFSIILGVLLVMVHPEERAEGPCRAAVRWVMIGTRKVACAHTRPV